MDLQEKIMKLYDDAFYSVINDNSIRNAFKIKSDSILNESGWEVDKESDELKLIRKEAVISSCSFSSMISEDGSCSIMGVSLNTNRLVEFFVTSEGCISLIHNLERKLDGSVKKSKSKIIAAPKKIHELQHYIKTTNELDI